MSMRSHTVSINHRTIKHRTGAGRRFGGGAAFQGRGAVGQSTRKVASPVRGQARAYRVPRPHSH